MTRSINSSTLTALQGDNINLATFIQMDFATPIRLTDWARNISYGGNTYTSSVHLIDYGSFNESAELRINSVSLRLSAVEQTYVALFLGTPYMDVRCRIWRAVLNDSDVVIGEPILVYDGRIAGYTITDTDTESVIDVNVASHWKDFELINGRKTNHNVQQLHFPGDMGFEFSAVVQKDIKWGLQ
jgi:hypothetical protein